MTHYKSLGVIKSSVQLSVRLFVYSHQAERAHKDKIISNGRNVFRALHQLEATNISMIKFLKASESHISRSLYYNCLLSSSHRPFTCVHLSSPLDLRLAAQAERGRKNWTDDF